MRIIFKMTDDHVIEPGTNEIKKERIAKVRLSFDENDMIERRRFDLVVFMKFAQSKKMKLTG